jgi:predicted nucleic acid-binding protein
MSRKINVHLDTNVLLDVLSEERRPGSAASDIVFQAIRSGLLEGELSTQSFLDASYIICRGSNSPLLSEKMLQLISYINMGAIDSFNLREAIRSSKGDLEDDAQYACALDGGCDVFLTNDRAFIQRYEGEDQPIRFFTPEEFVARLTGQTSAQ